MTASILKEFYMVKGTPVVVIMTDTRIGMQSWAADRDQHQMKRDYALMLDIVHGDHDGQISEDDFNTYCNNNNIRTDIPPKSIVNSFRLALQGQGVIKNVPQQDRRYTGPMSYAFN